MISGFDYFRLDIPMVKEFRISFESTSSYQGFLVRIRTDDGFEGWGEGVPTPLITGETMGSAEFALSMLKGAVTGMDDASSESIWDAMQQTVRGEYAAKCAIDTALWDITGRRSGMPLSRLLGGFRQGIATSYTIDLGTLAEAETMAQEFMDLGLKAVKVKLGRGMAEDYERVKTVRQKVGGDMTLYVDFNQSYSAKKAIELSQKIHKFEIEFLEQPTRADDISSLKFVRDRSSIPVMADESVHGPEDALRIIRMEAADMINLKLMKSGGISRGRQLIEIAEAAGLPVMIGCMVETKIATTAGTHLALGMKNVKYADLDGYTSLKRDVTTNGVTVVNGENRVSGLPGLGLEVDLSR